ncbi:MAG: flagellin [Puniceicoccaceae bacterium]
MDNIKLGSLAILQDYHKNSQRLNETLDRLSTGQRAPTPKSDPVLWSQVQQLKQFATSLSGYSDNLNRGAASVRVALDSMEVSRQHLLQLEQKLNAAFAAPPGSEERAYNLQAYNELHRYVEDAAKAPDAGARRLLDNPSTYPDAGTVRIRAGENGFSLTLKSQEIHTGASGLDIPRAGDARPSDLEADPMAAPVIADAANATDAEIKMMLGFLEEAKLDLTGKTKALAVDAKAIEDAQGFNEALVLRNKSQADAINVPDLNAEAVLAQSLSSRSSLALSGLTGLKETHRLALRLLQQ